MSKGGYALDMRSTGFGVVELGYHASAAYSDPLTDKLNVVIDQYTVLQSQSGTEPSADGVTLYVFNDLSVNTKLPYRWKGKLNILPHENTFLMCQVQADDYDDIVLTLYGDGAVVDTMVVTTQEPFTLAAADAYARLEIQLEGTSRVRRIQVVDDVLELV